MNAGAIRVLIGTELSAKTGTGHFMRMNVLAGAFRALGCEVVLFTPAAKPVDPGGCDIIVLDSYELDSAYIASLRKPGRLTVCVDDNALYEYDCDIILNANLHSAELEFRTRGAAPGFLLGGGYALLREEFAAAAKVTVRERGERILLCFGGSDARGFTPLALNALQGLEAVRIEAVLGKYTAPELDEEVRRICAGRAQITLHKAPDDMAGLMSSCDIAVTAAGSMVYESAALGLPTLTVTQAENQLIAAEYLDREGFMRSAGDWRTFDAGRLLAEVRALMGDAGRRREESGKLIGAVSAKGALNAAEEIVKAFVRANEIT